MVDINSEEYLQKLNKACSSDEGKVIIEFLKHELKRFEYEKITEKEFTNFSTMGMDFLVRHEINQYFKEVLSRFGSTD